METIKSIRNGAEKEAYAFLHWFIWQDNKIKLTHSEWIIKYIIENTKDKKQLEAFRKLQDKLLKEDYHGP